MNVKSWLNRASTRAALPLRAAVALGTCGGLLLILQAWFLSGVVNGAVFGHRGIAAVMPTLWALLVVFALRAGITWASERMAFRAAAGIKLDVRRQLLEHLFALGPLRMVTERAGELASTVTDGVEALEAYYARFLPQMALAALVPLAILVVVFPLDWISGLVLLVTAPIIPLMMVFIGRNAETLNQRQWRRLARLSAHFLDVLQGLTTLKLFNASRREVEVVAQLSDDYRKSTMAVLRIAFLSSLALEFLATVSIALVAVLIGFRLMWGELGFRAGLLILLLAPEFYLPLRTLGTHYHARMEAIGAGERIVQLLETPAPPPAAAAVAMPATRRIGIRLHRVRCAYEPGRAALDGVSIDIAPGERVALVGPSGAGKTTVVNLLLGFVRPESGEVLINGLALSELDPRQWLEHVAWVPQNPRIFHGTVHDNICLGRTGAGRNAVRTAARLALAEEFIEALPLGYDTVVGEGGQGLSGGQAQRLALARAFFKDAPVVLLDEPSANLDLENERRLITGIDLLAKDRTTITIAHRLNTVTRADRIVVLDRGQVAEMGTHRELLDRPGLYRRLVGRYAEAG
ncbi:MAG: thiol reductant ABC exporter subunit CydD [Acidiferrobacterales bacterium]